MPEPAKQPAKQPDKQEARALLAWMNDQQARLALTGGSPRRPLDATSEAALAAARGQLRSRRAAPDQRGLIRPLPADLRGHVEQLERTPEAAQSLAGGFRPALVDLSRVCVFQPYVHTSGLAGRLAGVSGDDLGALAGLTLPLQAPAPVTPAFDPERMTFTTPLGNQNLQVVGAFGGPADEGPPGTVSVGFHLRVVMSFVEVAAIQGRYFLRDGYFRCLGLVRRGIRYAPALVCDDLPLADLIPAGVLDLEAVLGDRPPLLPDYWDDGVSCPVRLPAPGKVVLVRASELPVTG